MYENYWNFSERPFQNTPDPRYLYLSPQHEDVLMKLTYTAAQGLGCGLLTGVFGCGKTLMARVLLRDLGGQRFTWAYVNNPSFSEPAELLRAILRAFNPQSLPEKKTELMVDPLLEKLYETLLDNIREGKENIIVVDEAHTIENPKIMEQLRLILNFQTEERFLLTLFILGQPELKPKIEVIKPLAQRIPIRCHLEALSMEESGKYINYRINKAKKEQTADSVLNPQFDSQTIQKVYEYTGGIPRKINTLCDFILMSGFAKKVDKISPDFVSSVVGEFSFT